MLPMSHCFKQKKGACIVRLQRDPIILEPRHLPTIVNKSKPIQPHNSKAKQNVITELIQVISFFASNI